jgi:hypothetical protein
MPYKSIAQQKWAHSPEGVRALGNKLDEWDKSTDYSKLPEHVPQRKTKTSIIKKLMKNKKKI